MITFTIRSTVTTVKILELPKEVIIAPEDSITMMKLQSAGYWRTINTRPTTPTHKAVTLANSSFISILNKKQVTGMNASVCHIQDEMVK